MTLRGAFAFPVFGPVLALALLAAALPARAEPEAGKLFGVWETEGGESRVLIQPCAGEEGVCGSLIWTASGRGKHLGKTILSDFRFEDGRWEGGRIHDPRDDSSWRAKLDLRDENSLKVRGCWLIFCGGQTWNRISTERVEAPVPSLPEDEDIGG